MANYGGRQANKTAYIKQFVGSSQSVLWKYMFKLGTQMLTPMSIHHKNVFIPSNLLVDESIYNPLIIEGQTIDNTTVGKILQIQSVQYTNIDNKLSNISNISNSTTNGTTNYGFDEQNMYQLFPELVLNDNVYNTSYLNYNGLLPVLIVQIQQMQNEINGLRYDVNLLRNDVNGLL